VAGNRQVEGVRIKAAIVIKARIRHEIRRAARVDGARRGRIIEAESTTRVATVGDVLSLRRIAELPRGMLVDLNGIHDRIAVRADESKCLAAGAQREVRM